MRCGSILAGLQGRRHYLSYAGCGTGWGGGGRSLSVAHLYCQSRVLNDALDILMQLGIVGHLISYLAPRGWPPEAH